MFFFHFTAVVVAGTFLLLLIPNKVSKLLFIAIGCFVLAVGAFLTGPSKLFELPDEIGFITAGMIGSGLGRALIQSYTLVYIITSGQGELSD